MGYKKQPDGTIVKVNYRTRMRKPWGRSAHLLRPTPTPEVPKEPTQGKKVTG